MKHVNLMLAVIGWGGLAAFAQDAPRHAAGEAAIRSAARSYVEAFNRGDAAVVAAHWIEDGELLPPSGQRFQGRETIQKGFEGFFSENPGVRMRVSIASIRFVTPDQAIEQGTARVLRPGEPPTETSYVATHVKQEGVWKLKVIREAAAAAEAPSHYGRLRELEWMIGKWVDRDENSTIETVCEWTKNRNFITRSFTVSIKDRIEIEGTQVVGWDPTAQSIRSWMFDSEGGFGEALWSHKGNRWIIKASRTLNGGEKASAVNILTYVDRNTFRWQSIGREIDGELLPNIDEVTVVRKQSDK